MSSERGREEEALADLRRLTLSEDEAVRFLAALDRIDEDSVARLAAISGEGKRIGVAVADQQNGLSPQHAADRLGLSRQHVVRLINAGELPAQKQPGSGCWQISLGSVIAFEERRKRASEQSDAFSRSLDAQGAPLE